MIITNNNNLPEPIFRAIKHNWYKGGGKHFASVTQLLKPPRIFALEKRHYGELTQEADEMIFSLMGSALHEVVAKTETVDTFNEERLQTSIDGKIVTGGVDLYEAETVVDFKFTSVYSFIKKTRIKEWEEQLNMYAYLYREAGFTVKKLQVIAVFRDWSKSRSAYEKDYPRQVEVIDLPLWKKQQAKDFISGRIKLFEEALTYPDELLPDCSIEDRWQKPDQYAVMKKGNKRATKLFETESEAKKYIDGSSEMYIETRISEPLRCLDYCSVKEFCSFYKAYIDAKKAA